MPRMNHQRYIERKSGRGRGKYRSWWLIKQQDNIGVLYIRSAVCFPKELIGKRIRLKVEVIEE